VSDEQQIAALREEIRRAGAGVTHTRAGLRRVVRGLLGVDVATLLASFARSLPPAHPFPRTGEREETAGTAEQSAAELIRAPRRA
jgi:hypothetical protein